MATIRAYTDHSCQNSTAISSGAVTSNTSSQPQFGSRKRRAHSAAVDASGMLEMTVAAEENHQPRDHADGRRAKPIAQLYSCT